ncbi:MAG: hypothetical protein JHD23_06360 [Akkermansiaceae bacterium]|nr:hypothetical protein [Akkermansiaceae bacterium]MBJ7284034.1 hypothetical protein [Akkermansiaceae bacterium]MBJ7395494.1 hypothetical protein [Akkermansiaceae bacterium]MBJ7424097.1 hypothetical protein [Akkermansiaceae bacterium]
MIARQKQKYPVSQSLRQYLYHFDRQRDIPKVYDELRRFSGAIPYEDPTGRETLWLSVMYPPDVFAELRPRLTAIYTELKLGRDSEQHEHLVVDRIDFGDFGNSKPFRIRVTNLFNDNSDYFYVKQADSSRIYGLELEHVLSPNRINYLVNGNTLIEEHIAGVPGDVFIRDYLSQPGLNKVRIAKEFTKFTERGFIRLLGDMRSVNYVVDITPDFEEVQYRVRAIDFDQQSYEGNGNTYLAFRFNSNRKVTRLAFNVLNRKSIDQYVAEEHAQMARRARVESSRLKALLGIMRREDIAPHEHVTTLARDLDRMHNTSGFGDCQSMGELTAMHISLMLDVTPG